MVSEHRRRFAWVQICVCLIVVLASGPAAAPAWTYASSPHFEVYTTGGDARAREALLYFERAHAFFGSYLQLSPTQVRPTRLVIFSNDKEYAPYRPNEFATAFYQPGPDRDYIVVRSLDVDSLTIVVHEYVHLLIRYSGERFPVWLNEGLAEYFSTIAPEAGKMSIGHVPLGRLQYLSNGSGRLMPLDKLFAVTHDSPEYTTKHAGTFYSEAWALTHMLLSDEKYRPQSNQFLKAITDGTAPVAALDAVYHRSPDVVFKDLLSYIGQDRYRYLLVDYKMPPLDAKPPTRPAAAFEAGLVTANLLAANRAHENEARTAFEALAKEHPDDLGLIESRGYFEYRRGHEADARPYFARAVELGSTNASLLRDYAATLQGDLEKAEALLTKSVSIAPDDVEARLRLANVLLVQRKTDAAIATLAPIKQVPPEYAVPFFVMLANAALQGGQMDEAERAAARASAAARNDDEKRTTAQLARSIDDYLNRRAALEQASRGRGAAGTPARSSIVIRDPSAPLDPPGLPTPKVLVAARITHFDCNTPGVLTATTATGTLRLMVEDLKTLRVESSGGPTSDIVCGPQNAAVRLGYDPGTNAALKTTGVVRLLDFRK